MPGPVTHRIGVIGFGVWGTHALQESLTRLDGVGIAAVTAHDRKLFEVEPLFASEPEEQWRCPECGQLIFCDRDGLPDVCDYCAGRGSKELTNWKRL